MRQSSTVMTTLSRLRGRRSYILVRGRGGGGRVASSYGSRSPMKDRLSRSRRSPHACRVCPRFRTAGVRITPARGRDTGTDKEKTSGHNPGYVAKRGAGTNQALSLFPTLRHAVLFLLSSSSSFFSFRLR